MACLYYSMQRCIPVHWDHYRHCPPFCRTCKSHCREKRCKIFPGEIAKEDRFYRRWAYTLNCKSARGRAEKAQPRGQVNVSSRGRLAFSLLLGGDNNAHGIKTYRCGFKRQMNSIPLSLEKLNFFLAYVRVMFF